MFSWLLPAGTCISPGFAGRACPRTVLESPSLVPTCPCLGNQPTNLHLWCSFPLSSSTLLGLAALERPMCDEKSLLSCLVEKTPCCSQPLPWREGSPLALSSAAVTVVCPHGSPTPLLTCANLFLAKHALETFEMKPIAEEEEEEEKVEVVKVPVAKPKLPEPLQTRSGTAAAAFGIGAAPPAAACAGTRWVEVMQCCRTEVALFAVVFVAVKITPGFASVLQHASAAFIGVWPWVRRGGAVPWLSCVPAC